MLQGPDGPLLGHTEQWYAGDEGAVGIVLDVPDDGPVLLAPVVAGTLPLVGVNEHGVAVGAMSLSARDERIGIPRALVGRDVLDARDAADATARAMRPGRAGGYSYQFAFSDGGSLRRGDDGVAGVGDGHERAHEPRDRSLRGRGDLPTVVRQPEPPFAREHARVDRRSRRWTASSAILADHDGAPESICAHPDPADGDEGSTILFAMVAEPARRSLTIASGHACTGTFETFELDDLR